VLRGTSQVDVFLGRGGNDRLVGKGGADLFCGGAGQDVIKGGGGDDVALGQGGDDELDGGPGTDELNGGRGTDECTSGETLANCETPQPEFDVDGSWAGTTSQGKDISFEISDHGITEITIGYAWTGPGCTSDSETTIMFGTAQKIVDNAFDIDGGAGTLDLLIHGEFTSDAAATGTFFAEDTGGFCPGSAEGTWDAAKT
jgi:Ca2+-binding RTX toxin-like protein